MTFDGAVGKVRATSTAVRSRAYRDADPTTIGSGRKEGGAT
jgi:hypothetical protein